MQAGPRTEALEEEDEGGDRYQGNPETNSIKSHYHPNVLGVWIMILHFTQVLLQGTQFFFLGGYH